MSGCPILRSLIAKSGMNIPAKLNSVPLPASFRKLQWTRGLRAGTVVFTAMLAATLLGIPTAWATLGGFQSIMVDNGGPYRSRRNTILTITLGGSIACILGTLAGAHWLPAVLLATLFCFAITYARVVAQPLATCAISIIVLFLVALLGAPDHHLATALTNATLFIAGCAWAATLSLFLWPLDPFGPARQAIADCYAALATVTANISPTAADSGTSATPLIPQSHRGIGPATDSDRPNLRALLETARAALVSTTARQPARTHRGRNLAVLLETADILLARAVRLTELAELLQLPDSHAELRTFAQSLAADEQTIANALRKNPSPNFPTPTTIATPAEHDPARPLFSHLREDTEDAAQILAIAFDSLRAIWTGTDSQASEETPHAEALTHGAAFTSTPRNLFANAIEALTANWHRDSVQLRHATRVAAVTATDVVIIHSTHINHGYWMVMTSIIVLQPYLSTTLKRSTERVTGTILGGILAALLAVSIHTPHMMIAAITIGATLTVATYAINYAWYCFFLTPTFVLMTLPYARDWRFAGVRILNTLLGAAVAIIAMRFFWPQRERLHLNRSLAAGAEANAAYLAATLQYWSAPADTRLAAEREILAPARRATGLANNDAEESLDRLLLEPASPLKLTPSPQITASAEHALAFVTYLRRFAQSTTTLAAIGAQYAPLLAPELESMRARLHRLAALLNNQSAPPQTTTPPSETPQIRRMQRQLTILETALNTLHKSNL